MQTSIAHARHSACIMGNWPIRDRKVSALEFSGPQAREGSPQMIDHRARA